MVDGVRSLREEVLSAMTPEDQEKSGVLEMVDSLNPLLSVSLSQISLVSGEYVCVCLCACVCACVHVCVISDGG